MDSPHAAATFGFLLESSLNVLTVFTERSQILLNMPSLPAAKAVNANN
ncbi:MAG: hypothetical protein AAGE59_24205 [Cyanobacteria bacterium P01_F01_bin.86]